MIQVILLYPDGQRREVILSGVPREGETIRLSAGRRGGAEILNVENVLWMEAANGNEPAVLVSVRQSPAH